MLMKRPGSGQRGFTLIELIIVVAIIGIICALIIPNVIDSLRKSKQKRTMSDMHLVGTSWMSWLTDQVSASAAGLGQVPGAFDWSEFEGVGGEEIAELLVPKYASYVPITDAWGGEFEYGSSESPHDRVPMGIRSPGSDGTFDAETYTRGPFAATLYKEDIVWVGGFFLHWPSGVATEGTGGS